MTKVKEQTSASLFGQKHSNRDYSKEKFWEVLSGVSMR